MKAMQLLMHEVLHDRNRKTGHKRKPLSLTNGAWGENTSQDLVVAKQWLNIRDVHGDINRNVMGKPAWTAFWEYARGQLGGECNALVVEELRRQDAARRSAAARAAVSLVRPRVVQISREFVERRNNYWYSMDGPPSTDLWQQNKNPVRRLDCSLSSRLIYKKAGAPDPCGAEYAAAARSDTYALWVHGTPVTAPEVGDLVFYGWDGYRPVHVAVYLGGGLVESFGSTVPKILSVNYRTDIRGYRSYL